MLEMPQLRRNSQVGVENRLSPSSSLQKLAVTRTELEATRMCQRRNDAWQSVKSLQLRPHRYEIYWMVNTQSSQFMTRQTTTKAPGPLRKRCTAQGTTRRGLHASRLGSNGHHCKASIFDDHLCNKKELCANLPSLRCGATRRGALLGRSASTLGLFAQPRSRWYCTKLSFFA